MTRQSPRGVSQQKNTSSRGKRGPDRIPRGSIRLLYETFLNDDGTLERSLKGDKSTRALAFRMMRKAIKHPYQGRKLLEQIGDRLEGKPVQKIQDVDPEPVRIIHEHA